jgi:hypothetical protein
MKTVYYNTTTSSLYDVEKGRNLPSGQYPWVRYREKIDLKIIFITGLDSSGDPVIDTSLDESLTYEAAIDKDHSSVTTVMAKTLNAGITVSAASGEITVSIDANTSQFQTAVDKKKTINGFFELQGNNVDELVWSIDFQIICKGTINAGSDDPDPVPASDYYTKEQVDAKFPARVANFAALPTTPTDLQEVFVTAASIKVIYDAFDGIWLTGTGAEFTADY